MIISKYNIISRIKDSSDYYFVNLLSGQADILTSEEAGKFLSGSELSNPGYISKGYVTDPTQEDKLYRQKYLDFIDSRDNDEVQIFFVSTYACNFKCTYCYQSGYDNTPSPLKKEVIEAFFAYIRDHFAGRRKYITLFGGEPLLNNPAYMKNLQYFFELCQSYNLELAIVTNGFHIEEFMPLLKTFNIREIQVTLDGMPEMHNQRRFITKGNDTFQKTSRGIDLLLDNNIPVNLRMVLDKENMGDLPALARFAIQKGWTDHDLFKTQLGRNYELHYCQSGNNKIFSRIEMYEAIYHMIKAHPEILEFHRPSFSISKYLFENGKLPDPLFDACPGCKTEWAFDYSGGIYSCTATVGKMDEQLGTFYPHVSLDKEKVAEWEERDVLSIEKCKDCHVQLACGGGCASIAKNTCGNLLSADCRPVKELLELGISLYK
jgi:uncharacterized protein